MGTEGGTETGLAAVVLTVGEGEALIEAVDSLVAQPELSEISVVSSGAEDPTGRLREAGLDVRVIHSSRRLLPGAARNVGIAATRARYVAFLGANCLAEPGWAAARLRAHRAGADAVSSALVNRHPESRCASASYLVLHHGRIPDALPRDRRTYGLSYDRRLFERFGKFREDLRIGEDSEFNNRLAADVRIVWSSEVRTAHRYPVTLTALLLDQFTRGHRRGALQRVEAGWPFWNPPVTPFGVVRRTRKRLRRSAIGSEAGRAALRRARPMVLPAAIAYALGLAAGRRGEGARPVEVAGEGILTPDRAEEGILAPDPLGSQPASAHVSAAWTARGDAVSEGQGRGSLPSR
jgi:hypothetical protein